MDKKRIPKDYDYYTGYGNFRIMAYLIKEKYVLG